MRKCTIEHCANNSHALGFCGMHYGRFKRHKDPLIIKRVYPKRALSLKERIENKILKTDKCWLWQGEIRKNGYGSIRINKKNYTIHRVYYELNKGQIPTGLTIDHLCRIKNCINPDHLEPVTLIENLKRGYGIGVQNSNKTYCPKGHEYNGVDKNGHRLCLTCRNVRNKIYQERNRN